MKEKILKVKIKKKKNLRQNQKRKKLKKIPTTRKNQKIEGHPHQGKVYGPNLNGPFVPNWDSQSKLMIQTPRSQSTEIT